TLLEKHIGDLVLLNGATGFGSIKIADLIKNKDIIDVHNISIITLSEKALDKFKNTSSKKEQLVYA
ncbi:MAG: hypothetical protein CVT95_08125, partial [Bacteroidetes bacterium HGW-Bacteroidetes-12]